MPVPLQLCRRDQGRSPGVDPLRRTPSPQEFLAQIQPPRVIHGEHLNGRASNRSHPFNSHRSHAKVILPLIPSRMEERYDLIGKRINPRKVRTLLQVAPMAGQCQVVRFIGPAVLFGYDMFDVVSEITVLLLKQAIFAAIPGPPADKIPQL
jgi:hypothetical protein